MVKKYYDDHEGAYRTIKEKGEFGWQAPCAEDFSKAQASELITSLVRNHFKDIVGKKALDLGCGTGPTTKTLHELGFQTTGIDISPTAIELARKMNPDIRFEVGDVLLYRRKFDFIYDSHCFHCIVTESDRKKFLKMINENLLPGGMAFIDTMIWREGYLPDIETLRFDKDFILWHPTKDPSREGCELYEDKWWCPQRRIYPAAKVLEEISEAGLKVLRSKHIKQAQHSNDVLHVLVSL